MYASSAEIKQLAEITALFRHPALPNQRGRWMGDITEGCRNLIGSDYSIFVLSDIDRMHFFSEDIDREVIDAFQDTVAFGSATKGIEVKEELMRTLHDMRKSMGPYVMGVDELRAMTPDMSYDSYEIYSDVIKPAGLDYPVSMGTPVYQGEAVISMFGKQGDGVFKERALHFYSRLLPAFVSGIHGYLLQSAAQHAIFAVFDALNEAMLVYTRDGRFVYANPAWMRFEAEDAEKETLRDMVQRFSRSVRTQSRQLRFSDPLDPLIVPPSQIETEYAVYHIDHFVLPESTLGGNYVAFRVDRSISGLSPELVAHYRLSKRECEVALCIARGLSNKEIAANLFVSVHTIRRHVESILRKLKVSSRAAIFPLLSERIK